MQRTLAAAAGLAILLVCTQAWACPSGQGWCKTRTEIGPRISHLQLVDAESDKTLPMGGVGGYLRYRLTKRLGLEGALDLMYSDELGKLGGREREVTRLTVPLTASALFYLFPNSKFQLYFLGGLGIAGNSVEYEALGETTNFAMPLAQFGVGGTFRGDKLRFDFSVRNMTMWRSGEEIEIEPLDDVDVRPVGYEPLLGDRLVHGAMITLGVAWGR